MQASTAIKSAPPSITPTEAISDKFAPLAIPPPAAAPRRNPMNAAHTLTSFNPNRPIISPITIATISTVMFCKKSIPVPVI